MVKLPDCFLKLLIAVGRKISKINKYSDPPILIGILSLLIQICITFDPTMSFLVQLHFTLSASFCFLKDSNGCKVQFTAIIVLAHSRFSQITFTRLKILNNLSQIWLQAHIYSQNCSFWASVNIS